MTMVDGFTEASQRHRMTSPSLHMIGLSVLFMIPGLLFATAVEWASSTSDHEVGMLVSAVILAAIGLLLWSTTSIQTTVTTAGVFSAVAWTWVAVSILGALPMLLGGLFPWARWDDALFESFSGFTTTGSTVLADIEVHGRGVLLWRQMTQFYGGMGMVVLAVAVLPFLGVGGLELISAEAPGPSSDRLAPRVTGTAQRLWAIYVGITVAVGVALFIIPGPSLYDSFAHALTTTSTGGFSPYNASIGHFQSFAVELVIMIGLLVSALNFAVHWQAVKTGPSAYARSEETRKYLAYLLAFGVTIIVLNLVDGLTDFPTTVRDVSFTVVTLSSSGGFGNARPDGIGDFVLWGAAAQFLLIPLMTIGGNAGSTAGGMKFLRARVVLGQTKRSLQRIHHPHASLPLKLGGNVVPERIVRRVAGFAMMFIGLTLLGTLIVAALGADPISSLTATISALGCVGPALGEAGPTSNYLIFTRPARLVLAIFMLIGRLEVFTVLLMFVAPARSLRLRQRWIIRR